MLILTSAKINISYSILFNLTTSYTSYFEGKKGISRNKTSFFLLMEEDPSPRSGPAQGSNGSDGSNESNSDAGSSDSVEGHLHPPGDLHSLVQEGGVRYLNYLLAKADTPSSDVPEISKIREWSYKDLLRLPKSQQIEWMDACHQELDSLRKRDTYDLVNPPPGRRII